MEKKYNQKDMYLALVFFLCLLLFASEHWHLFVPFPPIFMLTKYHLDFFHSLCFINFYVAMFFSYFMQILIPFFHIHIGFLLQYYSYINIVHLYYKREFDYACHEAL